MRAILLIFVCLLFNQEMNAQQVLGDFTGQDKEEWPRVIWYRDTQNNWDEGLIKTNSATSPLNRTGFGIHIHQTRQFGFWSTGWNPLFLMEGGSGNAYLRGNLGIGITRPQDKLAVNGNIRAKEVKVEVSNWPDYVFSQGHKMLSLVDLEQYIRTNGHLPEVPPAESIESEGVSLGEMNALLLKKIEELTLHVIDQSKLIRELQQETERYREQERRMAVFEKKLRSLTKE